MIALAQLGLLAVALALGYAVSMLAVDAMVEPGSPDALLTDPISAGLAGLAIWAGATFLVYVAGRWAMDRMRRK